MLRSGSPRTPDVFAYKVANGQDWGYLVRWEELGMMKSEELNALPKKERDEKMSM